MSKIPKAKTQHISRISPNNIAAKGRDEKVLFSFEILERNEFFNLDGTCSNWASDLFNTIKQVSGFDLKDIYAGKYSGKSSPLRIHQHENAKSPCKLPANVSLENMWQIRISKSKGGIHGVFYENIFYVIWLDPQHNLYPDKNHGGLKTIIPPSTCCKERDNEIAVLIEENKKLKEECAIWEDLTTECKIPPI